MGDARNKIPRLERDDRILQAIARRQAADKLSAALMAPFLTCRCGWTYYDRPLWSSPEPSLPRFYCIDCIPAHLRPEVTP